MMIGTWWLFVAAHVSFLVLVFMLCVDVCGSSRDFPGTQRSVFGLEFISEKLMVCRHSGSRWVGVPHAIGVALSLLLVQNLHTLRALYPDHRCLPHAVASVLCVWGWAVVIRYDHRRPVPSAREEWVPHMWGVGVFLSTFFALHVSVAYRYLRFHAMVPKHAELRRYSYMAWDTVYVLAACVFLVLILAGHIFQAIIVEYVVALAMLLLNLFSLGLLLRLGFYEETPGWW